MSGELPHFPTRRDHAPMQPLHSGVLLSRRFTTRHNRQWPAIRLRWKVRPPVNSRSRSIAHPDDCKRSSTQGRKGVSNFTDRDSTSPRFGSVISELVLKRLHGLDIKDIATHPLRFRHQPFGDQLVHSFGRDAQASCYRPKQQPSRSSRGG
jgi:hypothetical protein